MDEPIRVIVKRASFKTYWYASHIGEVFTVVQDPDWKDHWLCTANSGNFLIEKRDAKITKLDNLPSNID